MTKVSVIVPVLNSSATLASLFAALDNLDPPPEEILLVDNGSTDDSPRLCRLFTTRQSRVRSRLLEETTRGAAAARNRGIRESQGEVLAFTDSDCSPAIDWLVHLVGPFSDAEVGAVAGRVEGAPSSTIGGLFGSLYTLRLPLNPSRHDHWSPGGGGFPTANFAVRRHLALELGGFDEQVEIYGEDYDLCARLYTSGAVIEYNPQAVVRHHHRTGLTGICRQAFGFGRGHAYMLKRHGGSIFWIDLPRRTVSWRGLPGPVWLDLCSADKKSLALIVLGVLYAPLWLLPFTYGAYLSASTFRRAAQSGTSIGPTTATKLAGVLVLKSAAVTAGRWWGSARYRCFCL
jgi:GT2 family glycosyltransferase